MLAGACRFDLAVIGADLGRRDLHAEGLVDAHRGLAVQTPVAQRRLELLDIHTLGHLTALKKAALLRQFGAEAFGPQVAWLYDLAQGQDPRPLSPDMPPLRLIRTLTLSEPVADRQILANVAARLSWRISQALVAFLKEDSR